MLYSCSFLNIHFFLFNLDCHTIQREHAKNIHLTWHHRRLPTNSKIPSSETLKAANYKYNLIVNCHLCCFFLY